MGKGGPCVPLRALPLHCPHLSLGSHNRRPTLLPQRRAEAPPPSALASEKAHSPTRLPLITLSLLLFMQQTAPCLPDLFSFWPHGAPNPWLSRQSRLPRGAWRSRVSRIPCVTL